MVRLAFAITACLALSACAASDDAATTGYGVARDGHGQPVLDGRADR